MKLRPVRDNVLIRKIPEADVSPGGIFIPDVAKDKPTRAEVVATGPGRWDNHGNFFAMTVKPGDRVLISKWSGQEVTVDGEVHVFVAEQEIVAILDEHDD